MSSLELIVTETFTEISMYVPRMIGALLIVLIGSTVAKWIKRILVKILTGFKLSNVIKKTPVEHFLKNADMKQFEEVVGSVIYWLLMLVVLHTAVAVLGLTPLTEVLDRMVAYIPSVFSAVLILFLGILLAGVAESVVKGAIKSIDGTSARLMGKIASYSVVSLAVLAGVSELGIAQEFILIIFVGFVATLSLAAGLAFGLGGKDVVGKMLDKWYTDFTKESKK